MGFGPDRRGGLRAAAGLVYKRRSRKPPGPPKVPPVKRSRPAARAPRVGFVSLGCPKALVDTERVLTRLRAEGYELVGSYAEADLVVVSTCGFIEAAEAESLEAIEEAVAEHGRVVVTGCLGARAERLRAACPQVLEITGPGDEAATVAAVRRHLPPPPPAAGAPVPPAGLRLTPRHYAYLKVAEGCDHRCSFCIIPQLRGGLRSRPPGEVLAEARRLVEAGVRELLVVAQDTAAYGRDLGHRVDLSTGRPVAARIVDLARALGELGVWVRLHYVYPYRHVDALVDLMAEGLLVPYLDVPLQHASPRILRAMRRPAAAERMLERIARWRARCPGLAIRSTFIVGFPGETEADFETLLGFLEAAELDRVGCFTYSPVEGAAANALPGHVPPEEAEARRAELMARQAAISARRLAARVGRRETVLVDAVAEDGALLARSPAEAPEVDGWVRVRPAPEGAGPGDLLEVEITAASEHDLEARPAPPR